MATAPQSGPPDSITSLLVKGNPVDVVLNYQQAGNSAPQGLDAIIDCRNFNAVALIVTVTGTTPSAIISLLGSEDDRGLFLPLPDPAATATVTADTIMEAPVSTGWARVRVQSLTGAFIPGQGFTVVAVPYIAPGLTNINATLSGAVSVNNFPATQPVSATQLPASLGQKAMAASEPVVIASDQSGVPVLVTDGVNGDAGIATDGGKKALQVHVTGNDVASGGTASADEAAWTAGTSTLTPVGGVFNDSAAALTSGQQGTQRLTSQRGGHVNLRTAAGVEFGTSASPVVTTTPASTALFAGTTGSITVATQLAAQACSVVVVQNDLASANNLLVGNATAQVFVLAAGDSISLAVSNTNLIYVKPVAGAATANWLAR